MTEQLQKKVDRAIRLIQAASKKSLESGSPIEVCYSGGKDSDVILELTRMAGVPYRAIYKNTTIDPAGTIKHARDMGAEVIRPKKNFFQLIREHGLPSRFVRFCCSELKEYKVLDYAILGVRRQESTKRSKMYKEPELCRVYSKNEKVRQYFPILDWTLEDVAQFIAERNIRCAPVYYDEQGVFHAERRLGCMCCPLASRNKRLEDFRKHPNMVKLYIRSAQRWMDTHPNAKSNQKFSNAYELFVGTTFYDTHNEFKNGTETMFGKTDCKKFLEDYFKIKL